MPPLDSRPKLRRWLLALVALLALLVAAFQVLKRVLDVQAYRPQVEQEIARWTGLPTKVGRLELALRPIPCLSALDVSIGAGDLHLEAPRIDVFPRLRELLWRRLVISRIKLAEPTLTLPESGAGIDAALSELRRHIEAAGSDGADVQADPGSAASVSVRRVVAEDAVLRLGADTLHPLAFSLKARGLDEDSLELDLEAELPSLGASGAGHFEIPLTDPGTAGASGKIELRGLRPHRLITLPEALQAAWSAQGVLEPEPAGGWQLALEGEFESDASEALAGRYAATAQLTENGAAALKVSISADGLAVEGSGERSETGDANWKIAELDARGTTLRALLASVAGAATGLSVSGDAALKVRGLEFALPAEGALALRNGVLEAQGIEASWQGQRIGAPLRLDAQVSGGAIRIDGLRGGAVALTGRLTPIAGWGRVALVLQGKVGIDDALLRPLALEGLRDAAGVVELDELRTVFGSATEARPEDALALRARLVGGSLRFKSDAFSDRISEIQLAVSNIGSALRVDGRGRSDSLGAVELGASIEPDPSRSRGNLTFDAGAATRLISDEAIRAQLEPLLRAFGTGRLGFLVEWPDAEDVKVRLERVGAPSLTANLAIHSDAAGAGLGDLDITASLPGQALQGALPQALRLGGSVALHLQRSAANGRFALDADLAPLDLALGQFVEKRPGEALRLRVAGPAGEAWSAEQIELSAKDAKLALRRTDAGIAMPDLDLDLAAWSFLLVDGASVSGRLRGSVDPAAGATRLQLEQVALRLSPTLQLDSADGQIELAGKDWTVTGLHLQGARSDATLDTTLRNGHIEGKLGGANLDIDLVQTLLAEVRDWLPESDPNAPPSLRSGSLGIRLERIAYRRGEARNAQADLRWTEGDLQVQGLAFETYEGHVQGTVDVYAREGAPSQLGLNLGIEGVTGRFVDDLFSAKPRGVRGKFSGKLQFDGPLHEDSKAMWANANGKLTITGAQGSFGKFGFATQLTTVLRSSDALRLKLPSLKDEGLVFDTVDADVTLKDGRATIQKLTLDSTSYAATAGGYLDFRKGESRVPIEFDAIKGITGILGKIPVAGDAFKLVNVRLTATGSPFDLKIGIASITDQLIGATMVGPNAVIGGVRDVLKLFNGARKSLGGKATPPSGEPVAAPEATVVPEEATASAPAIAEPSKEPPPGEAVEPAPATATTPAPGDPPEQASEPVAETPKPPEPVEADSTPASRGQPLR